MTLCVALTSTAAACLSGDWPLSAARGEAIISNRGWRVAAAAMLPFEVQGFPDLNGP
jgi:hypothetical protein